MSPLLIKICKDFATIWTTIDPIGNVAIFAGVTASLTRAERHRTALPNLVRLRRSASGDGAVRANRGARTFLQEVAKRIGLTPLQLLVTAAGIYYVFHDPQKRAEIGQSLGGIKESESRRLLVTEKTVRGEPVAHRGIFGRRGHTSFGEFLALFRQQFH